MPSIKVQIAPSVLDWIGNVASLEGVNDKLLSHFYKWKAEEEQPTYARIETLSNKIHIPLGYFFLKTPPRENLSILKFRTVNSTAAQNPSRALIDTCYRMTAIQNWMRDYLIDQGNEQLSFAGSCAKEKQIKKIVTFIRKIIALEEDWYLQSADTANSFNLLRKRFENTGILILKNGIVGQNTRRPLDAGEFRAFTLFDEYAPLIFINSRDSASGQLFSLVHEIAHIWLGLSSFYNDNSNFPVNVNPLETLCNAVAAELLVPLQFFIEKWEQSGQFSVHDRIDRLAKYFKCGGSVIARRALDNNYINASVYHKIAAQLLSLYKKNKVKQRGGNYYDTAKSRFGGPLIIALDNSVKEGKTPYTEAFRLTGTNRITFANLVSEIRGQE
jgi:Zn-dependent peptidase ImmA (M78 family)